MRRAMRHDERLLVARRRLDAARGASAASSGEDAAPLSRACGEMAAGAPPDEARLCYVVRSLSRRTCPVLTLKLPHDSGLRQSAIRSREPSR